MTNAIVVPASFSGPVASVFQHEQSESDLSGGITGGYGLLKYRGKVWTIQYNGNSQQLMREDGDGPRGSVDIVIVKANPQLSKTWYENGWDENSNNPPDCASADGIRPDAGVPKKQADVCAMCPRNAWGSAPGGGRGKACGDHRRLAVVPLADLRNEGLGGAILLRCPAASLQDMAAFEARYRAMGYPYFTMAIKVGFDPQESYPKFTFQAIRPLTEDEAKIIVELRHSPATLRVVSETVAHSAPAVAAPAQAAFLEAPPANAVQPQQVSPQPAPVQQPVAQPVPAAQPQSGAGVSNGGRSVAGGFGPAIGGNSAVPQQPAASPAPNPAPVVAPAPQPAPAVAPAPQAAPTPQAAQQPAPAASAPRQMTGFGPATPEVTAAPSQQAQPAPQAAPQGPAPTPAATPATAPGVVSAFEGSIDDRLNALLAN